MLAALDAVEAAPGRGRAAGGSVALPRRVARQLGRAMTTVTRSYGEWYRGPRGMAQAGWPGWRARGSRLITSGSGRVVLGSGLGALALVGVLLWAVLGGRQQEWTPVLQPEDVPGAKRAHAGAGAKSDDPKPPEQPSAETKRLKAAHALLIRRACREASLQLKNLIRDAPKLAGAHYLLGASMFCRKRPADGLVAYAKAIELHSDYRADARILEDVGGLLKVRRRRRDRFRALQAVSFLEKLVGKPALPALVEATLSADRAVRHAAVDAAIRVGGEKKIDWVATLDLDVKQLSCRKLKERKVVQQLRTIDDPRVVEILRRARDARAGFFRHKYRYGCLRREIIAALEALTD